MIIDTPQNAARKAACLRRSNIGTVIRYYNFSNSSRLPEKCMTLAEAQQLVLNQFKLAAIFQQRQNCTADFTYKKGLAAGKQACRYALHSIGQPLGSGLYFAVDYDADQSDIENAIIPYFQGVHDACDAETEDGTAYRIGAYGSGLVCNTLYQKGLVELRWLCMSSGFRGTKEALRSNSYELCQQCPETVVCGMDVDTNILSPTADDFGEFVIDIEDDHSHDTTMDWYTVIARHGLRLREGAGTSFDIIGNLSPGQNVAVTSIVDGWARVDVEGDGQVDGFASAAFLEPVQRP